MAGRYAVLCFKGTGKIKGVFISHEGGDLLDRQRFIFQKFQSMFHTQHQKILLERHMEGFFIMAAAFIHGILKDGLTTWIPACLTVKFAIRPSFSVLLTMALPVVSLCGIPAAQTVNRRFFQNEAATGALCYLLSVGCFLCMLGGGGNSLYGTVVIFAIVTSMMTAVNTLLISLVPLHFGKEGRVATVSGILNAVTYLGSAAASVLFGYTMEYAGWRETQFIWCACAAVGGLCCAGAVGKWKRNREDMDG